MISKKDEGGRKGFWEMATADRVILPNGAETKRMLTYDPAGWLLLDMDDEYWLYPVEEIGRITCALGSRMTACPEGEPYAICKKSKYQYEVKDGTIVIEERVDGFKSTTLGEKRTMPSNPCAIENSDSVSHPQHYADGWSNGSEVIDLTEHLSFCAGNVVKYVCRAGRKDPDKHVEDLEKARWYLNREIERVKEQ